MSETDDFVHRLLTASENISAQNDAAIGLLKVAVQRLAERDARITELEKALRVVSGEECSIRGNELGEDYVQCNRCDASAWGSDREDIEHISTCVFRALKNGEPAQ